MVAQPVGWAEQNRKLLAYAMELIPAAWFLGLPTNGEAEGRGSVCGTLG